MTVSAIKKPYIILLGVVLFFVFLNILSIVWYVRPIGPPPLDELVYAGKILTRTEASLTTVDARGNTQVFILTDTTLVKSGRDHISINNLAPDIFVLVKTDPHATSTTAREIRVVNDKPKNSRTDRP
jgi:hypothetical protein